MTTEHKMCSNANKNIQTHIDYIRSEHTVESHIKFDTNNHHIEPFSCLHTSGTSLTFMKYPEMFWISSRFYCSMKNSTEQTHIETANFQIEKFNMATRPDRTTTSIDYWLHLTEEFSDICLHRLPASLSAGYLPITVCIFMFACLCSMSISF